MEIHEKGQLFYALHRNLVFNVTKSTRLIYADVDNNAILNVRVYMDREPTIDEKDLYYSFSGEVAGTYTFINGSNVQFYTSDYDEKELISGQIIFAICDYLDENGNLPARSGY
jgi:hypothetical protein